MVEIGIFDCQFDSRDITFKSDIGVSFDIVCLLNFGGEISCRVQPLTDLSPVNFGVFASTQEEC